jgi:hypothetical protein
VTGITGGLRKSGSGLNVFDVRGDGGDAEGVFEGDGGLDEANRERFLEYAQLALIQAGDDDFDLKIPEAKGARGGTGLGADQQALGRDAAELQVLGDILADTAAERDQQQFGRGHAVVGRSVFGGLIELDAVLAGFRGKAGAAIVLQGDFQNALRGRTGRREHVGGHIEFLKKTPIYG